MNCIIETEERLGFINLLDIRAIKLDKETQVLYTLKIGLCLKIFIQRAEGFLLKSLKAKQFNLLVRT